MRGVVAATPVLRVHPGPGVSISKLPGGLGKLARHKPEPARLVFQGGGALLPHLNRVTPLYLCSREAAGTTSLAPSSSLPTDARPALVDDRCTLWAGTMKS